MDYIRNLIDRVRRLELQNRVAKLEQLQAKLAGLAARDRAKEIIDQANAMKNAAAPFFIPVTVPPVIDQSSAGVHVPTVNPFPQSPLRSSSSVPRASSSAKLAVSSSTGTTLQLVSLYEKLVPFPSPLLIETEEHRKDAIPPSRHHELHSGFDGVMKHTRSNKNRLGVARGLQTEGAVEAAEALLQVATDEPVDRHKHGSASTKVAQFETETRQNAMLAFVEIVASAVDEDEKLIPHK
jgi:hypothetical protein